MNKVDIKVSEVTPEIIEEWKKQFGSVFQVDVDGHIAYLKKPDRKTISMATTIGGKDPIKFSELMLNNCWLAGDDVIKTDDELFLAVAGKLAELIELKEAELKKL